MSETRQRSSGRVIPHRARWRGRLAAFLIFGMIRLVSSTIRFRFEGGSASFEATLSQPGIFCIWHNRLALCLVIYEKYVARRFAGRRMAAMVSASRDGGMLARVLELFNVEPVRGSSSRRGPQALLEMTSWADKGLDLAITPDGPRGPRYQIQEGIVALAQVTGRPILPVAYHLNWKIVLKSWDGFQIPLPFACCTVFVGESMEIPREIGDAERETLRQLLESRLRAITRD